MHETLAIDWLTGGGIYARNVRPYDRRTSHSVQTVGGIRQMTVDLQLVIAWTRDGDGRVQNLVMLS